jgi:hypothetical protein
VNEKHSIERGAWPGLFEQNNARFERPVTQIFEARAALPETYQLKRRKVEIQEPPVVDSS